MESSSLNVTIDDLVIDNAALYESIRKSFSRDPFEHYVNGVCGLFICLLGTFSNALSFSILIRRTMRLSTYVYLAGLCLSDFTACLFLLPGYILDAYPVEVPDFELPRTYTYTKLLIISGAIGTTARALSVWLCVAFTIDRWIMICRPFVGPLYCTMKNARRVSIILYIFGFVYAVPLLYEHELHEEKSLTDFHLINHDKKIYRYKLSELGSNSIFRWSYALFNALFIYIIPITIIVILNRKLLTSIRLLEQRSAEYNAPLPTKQGVTVMLLATTIMLIVLRSPSAVISILWLIGAKMFINEKPPFPLRKFHSIANLCATLNAATTFIMFIIYGTKFRSEFMRIYCCIFTKFTQSKKKTLIRQEQQQQQMKQLISKNNKLENEQHVNDKKDKTFLSVTDHSNDQFDRKSSKCNSSATPSTTVTSVVSLSPMQHLKRQRPSFDHEYDLILRQNHHNYTKGRQYNIPVKEDQCNGDRNDSKSTLPRKTYFDWFKNLFGRRPQ